MKGKLIMKITIDRIESGVIIAELPDGQTLNLPGALLPEAAEGDIYNIEKDTAEGAARKEKIEKQMGRLFKG